MAPEAGYRIRESSGVKPICGVLPIATSSYGARMARRAGPKTVLLRAGSDAALMIEIQPVFEANVRVYGARRI